MKKLFRLANAEFNKIFYRPSMFILTALLIIALVLSNLAYKPVAKTTELSYDAIKVGEVYNMFIGTDEKVNKNTIDSSLERAKTNITEQFESITKDNKLGTLKTLILNIDTDILGIKEEGLRITNLSNTTFITTKSEIIAQFKQ